MLSPDNSRKKYLVGICSYNEGDKIRRVMKKFNDYALYDVLLIDDGSDDGSVQHLECDAHVTIVRNAHPSGAGFGTRQLIDYALLHGYEAVIFVSGNDKDDANDVQTLVAALRDGADFVQGSRYLPGGGYGNMPVYRRISTQFVHPFLFSLLCRRKITDSTNGFRAVKCDLFRDQRLDLNQTWLDAYELEPYLFFKAIQLGYQVVEAPVHKFYPPKKEGYTKMKPVSGWWSILRPIFLLGLRIKK